MKETGFKLAVVDAANVAHSSPDRTPRLKNILDMKRALEVKGYSEIRFFADAKLRHDIDEKSAYEDLVRTGLILQTPAGRQADEFLLQYANEKNGVVVSNDAFDEWKATFPWVKSRARRITFSIVDGEIIFQIPAVDFPRQKDMSAPIMVLAS
ncbi:MAG: hypothetical protein V3V92_02945, partial [Candidatus Hydrothermarchaeales archaeon]